MLCLEPVTLHMQYIASLPFFTYCYDYKSISRIIFCLEISHITLTNVAFAPFLFLAWVLTEVPHSQTMSLHSHSPSENSFWFLSPSHSRQTPISHSAVPANNCQRGGMSHFQVHFYALLNIAPVKVFFCLFLIPPHLKIIWCGLFLDCFKVYCKFCPCSEKITVTRSITCKQQYIEQWGTLLVPYEVSVSGWTNPEISNIAKTLTDVSKNFPKE